MILVKNIKSKNKLINSQIKISGVLLQEQKSHQN